ncbi:MAG: hypothetical protein ACUZ8H_00805 [Candidatus Anammoxibacter sp.]
MTILRCPAIRLYMPFQALYIIAGSSDTLTAVTIGAISTSNQ